MCKTLHKVGNLLSQELRIVLHLCLLIWTTAQSREKRANMAPQKSNFSHNEVRSSSRTRCNLKGIKMATKTSRSKQAMPHKDLKTTLFKSHHPQTRVAPTTITILGWGRLYFIVAAQSKTTWASEFQLMALQVSQRILSWILICARLNSASAKCLQCHKVKLPLELLHLVLLLI